MWKWDGMLSFEYILRHSESDRGVPRPSNLSPTRCPSSCGYSYDVQTLRLKPGILNHQVADQVATAAGVTGNAPDDEYFEATIELAGSEEDSNDGSSNGVDGDSTPRCCSLSPSPTQWPYVEAARELVVRLRPRVRWDPPLLA